MPRSIASLQGARKSLDVTQGISLSDKKKRGGCPPLLFGFVPSPRYFANSLALNAEQFLSAPLRTLPTCAGLAKRVYFLLSVAGAGAFFAAAVVAGLTVGVAAFGLPAPPGVVWALTGMLAGPFIVVGTAVFIAALFTVDAGVVCKGTAVAGFPLTIRCCAATAVPGVTCRWPGKFCTPR